MPFEEIECRHSVTYRKQHLRDKGQVRLKSPWVSDVFHSTFDSKAKGVAIMVNKRVHFTTSKIIADKNGKYIIVPGLLYHNPVLFVNIYAPNFDNPDFRNRLFATLPFLDTHF